MACLPGPLRFFAAVDSLCNIASPSPASMPRRLLTRFPSPAVSFWLPLQMSSSLIQALPHAPAPPLSPPTLDALSLSDDVEAALRALLTAHRQRMRLAVLETCRQQGRVPPAFVAPSSLSDSTSYGSSSGGAAASASVSEDELAASTAAAPWSAALEHRLQVALAAYELVSREHHMVHHRVLSVLASRRSSVTRLSHCGPSVLACRNDLQASSRVAMSLLPAFERGFPEDSHSEVSPCYSTTFRRLACCRRSWLRLWQGTSLRPQLMRRRRLPSRSEFTFSQKT